MLDSKPIIPMRRLPTYFVALFTGYSASSPEWLAATEPAQSPAKPRKPTEPNKQIPRRPQRRLLALALILLCVMGGVVIANWDAWSLVFQGSESGFSERGNSGGSRLGEIRPVSEGFQPVTVIHRVFPPIEDVPHVGADQAGGLVRDEELVLGVVVGAEARAYPINTLTGPQREIVNDTLGDSAIAATW